ncbi:MAG: YIP1 family protein [Deltaproteobacteria bacterium]|nr:YIP1 family protein [Deltaproteobacteria bacterium]
MTDKSITINDKQGFQGWAPFDRIFRIVCAILFHPRTFYERLLQRSGYTYPIIFLFLCSTLHSICATMCTNREKAVLGALYFMNAFFMPFITAFLAYLATLILCRHVFSYQTVLSITAYANATLLLAWIPGISWVTGIWTYGLIGLGMAKVGPITASMAFRIILITAGCLFLLIQFALFAGRQG